MHPLWLVLAAAFASALGGCAGYRLGAVNPEPIPENLLASRNVMLTGEYDLAICNDVDADRLGVLERARILVDEHRRNADMRERQRCGQPRRSPADDQHRCLAAHHRLLALLACRPRHYTAAGTG